MKNIKNILYLAVAILLISTAMVSCQKDIQSSSIEGKNNLKVFLTDAPVRFDHVYINIQAAEIKIENDSCSSGSHDNNDDHGADDNSNSGSDSDGNGSDDHGGDNNSSDDKGSHSSCETWETLQINAGTYDLLSFRNGVDALIASGSIPKGEIKAIKLTLGSNNSVVIDSISYPLAIGNRNIVTIKIDDIEKIDLSNLKLNLDFDLAHSIFGDDHGFELHPSIKPFNESKAAKIEGRVLPAAAKAILTMIGDKDTLMAIPGNEGEFKIRGIKSSRFDLQIKATANGYKDTTITNLQINADREVKIGSITLHR